MERHRKFLHLHRTTPGRFIVPAYDMDLVWHTHMVTTLLALQHSKISVGLCNCGGADKTRFEPRQRRTTGVLAMYSAQCATLFGGGLAILIRPLGFETDQSERSKETSGVSVQACSPVYFADCASLFGGVFAHDDSVNDRTPGKKLDTNWQKTQVQMLATRLFADAQNSNQPEDSANDRAPRKETGHQLSEKTGVQYFCIALRS